MSTKRPKSLRSLTQRKLSELIILERKAANLTQSAVASKIGWPQSDISKVETGERRLDVIELIALSEAIGFDTSVMIDQLLQVYRSEQT